uniref:Uncharacterized protein n=1 Tax=Arundo donax TaxID=35708 RepID=A0A0A9B5G9_ARUDO
MVSKVNSEMHVNQLIKKLVVLKDCFSILDQPLNYL